MCLCRSTKSHVNVPAVYFKSLPTQSSCIVTIKHHSKVPPQACVHTLTLCSMLKHDLYMAVDSSGCHPWPIHRGCVHQTQTQQPRSKSEPAHRVSSGKIRCTPQRPPSIHPSSSTEYLNYTSIATRKVFHPHPQLRNLRRRTRALHPPPPTQHV